MPYVDLSSQVSQSDNSVRPGRGVANEDIRVDAGLGLVALFQRFGEGRGMLDLNHVDGAAAEPAASEAGAYKAGHFGSETFRQFHHGVGFNAAAFEVLAVADVRLMHKAAQGGQVAPHEGIGCVDCALIFGDDVAGALEGIGRDFVAPCFEILHASRRAGI